MELINTSISKKSQKPKGGWTKKNCRLEALKYTSKKEFILNSNDAYDKVKINGWMKELCSHMIVDNISIYGIRDIRDNSIIYVGKTTKTLKARFRGHCCDKKNIEKYNYLKEHREFCEIILLEYLSETDIISREREHFYIEKYTPSIISNKIWFNKKKEIGDKAFVNGISVVNFIENHFTSKKPIILEKHNARNVNLFMNMILEKILNKEIRNSSNLYYDFIHLLMKICDKRLHKIDIYYFTIAYIKLIKTGYLPNNISIILLYYKDYLDRGWFEYDEKNTFFVEMFPITY